MNLLLFLLKVLIKEQSSHTSSEVKGCSVLLHL